MLEKTLAQIGKQLDTKIKLPTVYIVCISILAFLIGVLTGTAITAAKYSKKLSMISSDDYFDDDDDDDDLCDVCAEE
jgi:hypothetical protein